jgi:hypothetical protein
MALRQPPDERTKKRITRTDDTLHPHFRHWQTDDAGSGREHSTSFAQSQGNVLG